jgi:DNA-binding MarR family transcriptional regulator/GNAT superfamily N-acetyltransferase
MDPEVIAQARRFNRIVTQRLGALDDHFLARARPLGEARLLWEIGAEGRDVRSLRTELDLDSGYTSRLLRSLEAAGMVTVGTKKSDKRVRVARLTRKGVAERAALDKSAEEHAKSLLAPLSEKERARLVAAMADVERLLTASLIEIAPIDPSHPHAQHCLRSYFAELNRRFDTGFDPARSITASEAEMRPPAGLFLLAALRGNPIGSGALKFYKNKPPDIKRMWVDQSARGLGVGRRILGALEKHAAEHGAKAVRLETNKTLVEAISLYRSTGYTEVPAFNDEPYANHWFVKKLSPQSSSDRAAGSRAGESTRRRERRGSKQERRVV